MSIHDGRDDDSLAMNMSQVLCDWCNRPAEVRIVHPLDSRVVEPACSAHDYSERMGARTLPV